MLVRIKNDISRFFRDQKGDASLEAIIFIPILLVIFVATWIFFDVFRQTAINQKANYTIGDILSRETEIITETYIDNAQNLLYHLAQAEGDDVDLRVSVVQFVQTGEESTDGSYMLVWSKARGDWSAHVQADMVNYTDQLPLLAPGDQSILVETRDWYEPTFQIPGIEDFDISTYSFTRPRFAPQVIFEGINDGSGKHWQNNGWGNGDQDAPGGSLCNNNAENGSSGDADHSTCTSDTSKANGKKNKKKS